MRDWLAFVGVSRDNIVITFLGKRLYSVRVEFLNTNSEQHKKIQSIPSNEEAVSLIANTLNVSPESVNVEYITPEDDTGDEDDADGKGAAATLSSFLIVF